MLYLRNTNQQQSLDRGIRRGITSTCCTPVLNSVTSASLTQVTVNGTLGTYLVNCKSCVGGYIQVSENSGSSWTTINPGNCSSANLAPMPSQSAYYRLYTSCSANNQPNDPLTSSFSNEILFIPNGYINYKYSENISSNFKIATVSTTYLNASSSVSGTLWQIPSASFVTASLTPLSFPITGSTSMSLSVTGSNVSYTTQSCVYTSSILLKDWKVIPNQFYDVTASISYRPENSCGDVSTLGYTVNSFNQSNGLWYHANQYGVYDTSSTAYPTATITGSAVKTNVASGDCRFNAIQFSGSINLNVGSASYSQVYMSIVTGSFTMTGADSGSNWSFDVRYQTTGSYSAFGINSGSATTKNSLVGFQIGAYIPASFTTQMPIYVSGSLVDIGAFAGSHTGLGQTLTITGQGIIRGFGLVSGDTSLQSQYNCIYDTTPSK